MFISIELKEALSNFFIIGKILIQNITDIIEPEIKLKIRIFILWT